MAAGTVDNLNIQLQAQANQAVGSIDVLITRLTKLNNSLNYTNRSGLTGVANGVNKLGTAMQGMKSVGAADFTRLAKNISKISSLDTNGIQRAASAIGQISKSLGSLKSVSVSGTSKQVADLAIGISRLGYKSSTKAIENIPKLATAMNGLMASLSKAPRVSQNLIDMTNALGRLAKTGASSGKAASSLSRSLNSYTQSADRASKSSKGFASALGKMYATYWLIFRAFGKIGDSIEIASDLVEVQNVVDTVFGDMSGKVEQYAQNSIKQFGMSELAFKQYSSRFQAMGAAMGIDSASVGQANKFLNEQTNGYVEMSDSMADVSINLTKLAADMASFYNVEQSAVAEDLAAIFTGETRPLRTYGLDLTQATLSEWAMKQGLDANIASMSQMEKTMLRYQYVLANTTAAQNDFQRTQNTWANQLRILQEQFKQFASVMGTGFIAAFKPVLQTLNNVMGKVISFTETVLNALGHIFGWQFEISGGGVTDDLADSLGGVDESTGDAAGNAGDLSGNLGEAAENAKKLYSTVLGIDELNINNPDTGTPGSSGSGGSSPSSGSGGGSGSGSGTGGGGLTTVMTRNDAILKAYESSIDTLYELGEYIGDTLTNVMNGIDWDSVYRGARNFGKGLADFLNGLISPELFGATGRTIAGALNAAIYAALSFGQTFDFYDFGVSIATGINEFFRTFDFASLAQTINVWVNGIRDIIVGALLNINWGNALKAIYDFVSNLELDTAILVGWYALPKIFKAVTSNKIVKGFSTLVGSLRGNETAVLALRQSYPKLSKVVDVARKAFQNFRFGIENGNFMTGLNEGVLAVRNSLTKMQKGIIGVVSVVGEFYLVKDAFYDLAMGSENVVGSIAQIGVGAGVASAALYTAFGPAGVAVAAITGLVGALFGLNQAFEEQEEINLFGDKLSNITSKINETSEALKARAEQSREFVETSGLAEAQVAQQLSDKYFALAGKESLTNEEKEEMRRISQLLIDQFPELETYYNEQTGLLDTTKESIDKLIQSRLQEIQLSSVEEELTQAYKDQRDALANLQAALEPANTAQEHMNELNREYQELADKQALLEDYNKLSEKINTTTGDTSGLIEKQQELWNEITNEGKDTNYLFPDYISQKMSDVSLEIDGFRDSYNEAIASLSDANEAYEAVSGNITTLTEMLTSGMVDAANNSADGYANTLSKNESMANSAKSQAEDILSAFAVAQDSHSPSKKFASLAKDSIDGYVLGTNKNRASAINAMTVLANSIASSFGNSLLSKMRAVASKLPDYFTNAWSSIKNVFSPAPEYFKNTFTLASNNTRIAFQTMPTWFHKKWDETKAVFKDVQSYFKSGFTSAYKAITSSFSGLSSFFRGVANDIIDPIGDAINGVIKGMNWILDELGSSKNLKSWSAPKFASGSSGVPRDTVGVVNDQPGSTYRELIVPPSGNAFIPTGRNVMLPLEKGTKIMPAGQTKALFNGMPHFARGIGSFFGNAWASAISYTGDPMDYFDNPGKLVQIAFDKFIDTSRWTGAIGNVGVGVINTIFDSAVAFIKKIFGSGKIEQAVRWAIGIANDNSHGYDQAHRTGPDYDCSSLVTIALKKAGFNIDVGTTSTMLGQLLGIGFSDVTSSVNRGTGANMRRGDVLLKPGAHTAMYIGDGKIVHARINEFGGITGGKTGDQTGDEIAVTPYHNHPWTYVLRYAKAYKNGIGRINLSDLIPAYSVGGFPEDGLFMANHNELVGQFSDGRTAVANNTDIQKGIEEAAYRGFARANAENTRQISLLEELIDAVREGKEIVVDGRSLTDAVDRRRSRNGYAFT